MPCATLCTYMRSAVVSAQLPAVTASPTNSARRVSPLLSTTTHCLFFHAYRRGRTVTRSLTAIVRLPAQSQLPWRACVRALFYVSPSCCLILPTCLSVCVLVSARSCFLPATSLHCIEALVYLPCCFSHKCSSINFHRLFRPSSSFFHAYHHHLTVTH